MTSETLAARVRGAQVEFLDERADDDRRFELCHRGADAPPHAAAEGDPGVAAGSGAEETLRLEGERVGIDVVASVHERDDRNDQRAAAPQIVIGQRAIGGADALARLDRSGALDGLIGGERFPRAVVRRRLTPDCVLRWLLTTPFGGACGIRTITVDMVDEHGRLLERRPAATPDAAELLADALNAAIDQGV